MTRWNYEKLNDLARSVPRLIDDAGVTDPDTREAVTHRVAAPLLVNVSERDQAIEALQARVAELEAGLRRIVDAPMLDHTNYKQGAQYIARALLERNPS